MRMRPPEYARTRGSIRTPNPSGRRSWRIPGMLGGLSRAGIIGTEKRTEFRVILSVELSPLAKIGLRNGCQNSISRPPQRDGNRRTAPEPRCRLTVPAHPRQSGSATTEPATRTPPRRVVPRTEFRNAPPRYRNPPKPTEHDAEPKRRRTPPIPETRAQPSRDDPHDWHSTVRPRDHPRVGPDGLRRRGRRKPASAPSCSDAPTIISPPPDPVNARIHGVARRSGPRRCERERVTAVSTARAGPDRGPGRTRGGAGLRRRDRTGSAHSRIPGVSSWTGSCRASRNRSVPRW